LSNAIRKLPSEHLVVLAGFLVSTLIMTLPVVLSASRSIPMDSQIKDWYPGDGDPWHYLWGFWYFKQAFRTFPPHPFWTDLVFYPLGFQIPFLTGVGVVLLPGALLAPLIGLTLTYNVLWVLSFVLAGYAMYLLAGHLFHDRVVAFFCGQLFMFSSYRMLHGREHLPLLMASCLVPLFVLLLCKAAAQPTMKRCAVAAFVLAVSAGVSWYCTIGLSIYLAVFVATVVRDRPWTFGWPQARAVTVGLLVLAVTASPFVLPMAISPVRDSILTRALAESNAFSADLVAFFVPSPTNPVFGKWTEAVYARFTGNPYEQTVYLGYVLLGLALWGMLSTAREKTRLFVAAAATFFVLALGPFLHVNGQDRFSVDGEPLSFPLPYLLLRFVPFVNGMRVPSRFVELVVLSLIVLAGYGLSSLCARVRARRWRYALVGGLLVAGAIELASVPYPVARTEVPRIYREIATVREPFTVLELPLDWHIIKYHYYQAVHGKRLVVGHPVRSNEKYSIYPAGLPLFPFLKEPKLLLEREIPSDARLNAERLVAFFDVRYVVLHRQYLDPRVFVALDRFVATYFPHGERWTDGDVVAYPIGRGASPVALWPDDYVIDFGASRPYALFSGWDDSERWGETTVQWALDGESSMFLYLEAPTDRVLEMRLLPLTYEGAPPQVVSVYVNGTLQGRLTLEPRWGQYRVRVPARVFRAGLNRVTFTYGRAVAPAKVIPGSSDSRKLAVAFDYVALRRAR
jgi:hypothetical protein